MIVYSPNSCCCAVSDYVAVLALAAVYVNSLNKALTQLPLTQVVPSRETRSARTEGMQAKHWQPQLLLENR